MPNPFAVEARIRELSDRAATEFLAPLAEKRGSPDWISKNAEKILKESGQTLNGIAAKIASEENLNPHMTARFCEETNKEVFARLYKTAEDKTFQFGLASSESVLKSLDRPYDGPGDLFLPIEHPKMGGHLSTRETKLASSKKLESLSWARSAMLPSDGQAMELSLIEEKQAYDALSETYYESQSAKYDAGLEFVQTARDMVLDDGWTPSRLYQAVLDARPGKPGHHKIARELLAVVTLYTGTKFPEGSKEVVKVGESLLSTETGGGEQPADDLRTVTPETYEFWTASIGKRPEELVSPVSSSGDPVIINARHKLFITLDTLVDQTDKENFCGKGLLISGDQVRTLTRAIVNWRPKTEGIAP